MPGFPCGVATREPPRGETRIIEQGWVALSVSKAERTRHAHQHRQCGTPCIAAYRQRTMNQTTDRRPAPVAVLLRHQLPLHAGVCFSSMRGHSYWSRKQRSAQCRFDWGAVSAR